MSNRIVSFLLVLIVAAFTLFGASSSTSNGTVGSMASHAILAEVQDKVNRAKTFTVMAQEEKGGVKIETKCVVKQHEKGVISCRQEQRVLLPGTSPQSFLSIMDRNKLYFFPTGCGKVVVRMKYLERYELDSPVANLFFQDGTCEKVMEDNAVYSIRYTCTPKEIKALKAVMGRQLGVAVKKDMIPAVLDYKITKESRTLSEVAIYSERGKLITKQLFNDWLFDMEIPDSTFELPKGYKQYVVKSAKEAEKLQAELMKNAMSEQSKKQQLERQLKRK